MIKNKSIFIGLLFLLFASAAHAQIMYRSRYKSALLLEGFGLSPIMSVNYEAVPLRYHKSYISGRVGLGYMPASLGNGAGISFPVGVSYNFMLNNLKAIRSRMMNKCKSMPAKVAMEYFVEMGPGYSHVIYPSTNTNRNYFNALLALKGQMFIDIPPKLRVITFKVSVNPRVYKDGLKFYEKTIYGGKNFFGGFAIGFSI
ncbi:hypothetical protein LAG90_14305 [Marinilongibacter aquaticus]|uniref:hypothetical protein n=1 Tax=Marinilongibacter aquaticus TaxID=2975157 RepID=UPI0021BDDB36|nr:hypothetical protein [Marinilongibacter aquaticus]UBM57977.1 hypothetical protein LAG90_14305 [Marinilongibacter aquaticus]